MMPPGSSHARILGQAAFQLGQPEAADSLLTAALDAMKDDGRRAELSYDRARARRQLGRLDAADADLRAASKLKPGWAPPRLERVKLLVQTGRGDSASAEFARIMSRSYAGVVEQTIVETAHEAVETNPAAGVQLLAGVEEAGLLRANRADLVELRGALALTVGDTAAAMADFSLVRDLAPDSPAAVDAYLALGRIGLRRAASTQDLEAVRSTLTRAVTNPSGNNLGEVRHLLELSRKVAFWVDRGGLGYMAAAEAARDELNAPRLARHLFLEYADRDPQALWAPKAILAAIELSPVDSAGVSSRTDGTSGTEGETMGSPTAAELRARLLHDYRHSAYVEVLVGGNDSQFTYEELETGLRAQLERMQVLADQQLRMGRTGTGRDR
jgi:tetratricopeptide (TPR) repeat protein